MAYFKPTWAEKYLQVIREVIGTKRALK